MSIIRESAIDVLKTWLKSPTNYPVGLLGKAEMVFPALSQSVKDGKGKEIATVK